MSTTPDPIFAGLNEEQTKAVNTLKGPLLILAGAGSGKTRTITHRIAHLISQGVPAWQILAVTFTNKAANELKERIARILRITSGIDAFPNPNPNPPPHPSLPLSGTFHSICVRILRRDIEALGRNRSFVIYDTDDQEKLMVSVLKDMKITPEELKPRTAIAHVSGFKSEAVSPSQARTAAVTHTTHRLAEIYNAYQKKLKEANAMDFDDLLLETVRLFTECPEILKRYQDTWRFLHVDEYQDTNHVQYLLISLLAKAHHNLCVIGDPDQSIYAFRGADIRNILQFQSEYKDAVSIKLERNYRSTQQVLDAADGVIGANPNRPQKKMWTDRTNGAKILLQEVMDERKEAEEAIRSVLERKKVGIPLKDQVILYRTNAQSRQFEEACLRAGVPYRILGGMKFYARREVKDILAYLYVILNPNDTLSLLRIVNVPSRKIGDTTLGRLQNFCNERSISLWQAMQHIAMVDDLNEGTKNRIAGFTTLIQKLQELAKTAPVSTLAEHVISETHLEKWVKDDTDEGETRWENILELVSVTKKYDHLPPQESLMSFLEEVALISEVDKLNDQTTDSLTLMTLHLCKGLEFSSVTIVGCEEGILPHSASQLDHEQMEEERRLLYVGMTRAKDHLTLMHAGSRMLWGSSQSNARSRFLSDIPQEVVEVKSDVLTSQFGWLTSSQSQTHSSHTRNPYSRSSDPAYRQAGASPESRRNSVQPFIQKHDDFNQDTQSEDWLEHVEEELSEGMRIVHKSLGIGTVRSRSGDIIEVQFENGTTKRLALGIAPIRILKTSEEVIAC